MSPALKRLAAYQELLQGRKFYGQLIVRFQEGEPVRIKTEQEFLPEGLPQPPPKPKEASA